MPKLVFSALKKAQDAVKTDRGVIVMDDYEKFATALLIVFSALIVGGMMALHIAIGTKSGFLFALGAGVIGWFSAFAILFDKPRVYFWLIIAAIICIAASIGCYVK